MKKIISIFVFVAFLFFDMKADCLTSFHNSILSLQAAQNADLAYCSTQSGFGARLCRMEALTNFWVASGAAADAFDRCNQK